MAGNWTGSGDSTPGVNGPPRTMQAVNLASTDYTPTLTQPNEETGQGATQVPVLIRWIYVGVSGNIAIEPVFNPAGTGTPVIIANAPVGWMFVQCKTIYKTSTTATNLVAAW